MVASETANLCSSQLFADLDSMSCSILFAYLRTLSPPKNAFSPLYVPITNIPAADIQLRPEFLAAFKHANIEPKHLITLDDLPHMSDIERKLSPEHTSWVLVDHNVLQGQLGKIYAHRVIGVIDHHDDEGKIPKDRECEVRIIEKTGSCTSLVVNYCRPEWESLSEGTMPSDAIQFGDGTVVGGAGAAAVKQWDAEVARLGMASILIDTANLEDQSKTTEHDRKAVDCLESKIKLDPLLCGRFDRPSFYQEINGAKKDIGSLQLQDILRKDYKQWDQGKMKLGISSVVKSLGFLQHKAGDEARAQAQPSDDAFLNTVATFAKARELDSYAIMTTSSSSEGNFQRELLLWAFDDNAVSAAKKFATDSKHELGLEDWHESSRVAEGNDSHGQWRKVWWQRQVQHSRKRVAPLLRETMA